MSGQTEEEGEGTGRARGARKRTWGLSKAGLAEEAGPHLFPGD